MRCRLCIFDKRILFTKGRCPLAQKRVVLVGRDAAPSGCFKRLEPVLKDRGFDVTLFIGDGKPLPNSLSEISAGVAAGGILLLGMSSSLELSEPEIVAGKAAMAVGVPYGFYGDVPLCWGRARPGAWFEELASGAQFYCGITQADADAAASVFPNARLLGTGNPLREEMAFPSFTRDEVRTKLGIAPEEKMVLAPGGKFAAGNMASWVVLMDALNYLVLSGRRFQLVLATHPGDRTAHAVDPATSKPMRLYEELALLGSVSTSVVPKETLTTSDMVPGADIIVEFGSSIGIEGAYQGVPVVTLGFDPLFRRLEKVSGSRDIEAVTDGLSMLVHANFLVLAQAIGHLLTPHGFAPMRARQLELCPRPTDRGAALRNIANAIVQVAR